MAAIDPLDAGCEMAKVAERQPTLRSYVMVATDDCSRDAQELACHLLFVVSRMFHQVPGYRLRSASIDEVERCEADNEALVERLADSHDLFLSEAILEGGDPDLELTDHESGLLFPVFRTVVDVLDEACTRETASPPPRHSAPHFGALDA